MSDTLYESYPSGDQSYTSVSNTAWGGQTFTPSTEHAITSVKFLLYRVGSPGTITVSIRACTNVDPIKDRRPTGADLRSGTTDGNTLTTDTAGELREITLTAPYVLSANTTYAICGRSAAGTLNMRIRDGESIGYANGEHVTSSDSGVTWTASALGSDAIFYEYGNPTTTTPPTVTIQATTNIGTTTATGHGNVTALGSPPATQHGHVWAIHSDPRYPTDSYVQKGIPTITGAFTSSITGLEQNTYYYMRAYIVSSLGTFYSAQMAYFITAPGVPVVLTTSPTDITQIAAIGNGQVSNTGGSPISEHGFVWDKSNQTDPEYNNDSLSGFWGQVKLGARVAPNEIGTFFSPITGLTAETTYKIRAYAVNSAGTGYGAVILFSTDAAGVPTVSTQVTTNIQDTTATGNGTLISTGGATVTEHGHVWKVATDPPTSPTTADSKKASTASIAAGDTFTSEITGLTFPNQYYIRAYATNSYGTSYGNNDIIGIVARELQGNLIILGEHLAYTSKTGVQRALKGVEI